MHPDVEICPECGHKLQWIAMPKPENYQFNDPPSYWGCIKCRLKGPKKFRQSGSNKSLYWYKQVHYG